MSVYVLYMVLLASGAPQKTAVDILPSMAECQYARSMQTQINNLMQSDGLAAVWICRKEPVK